MAVTGRLARFAFAAPHLLVVQGWDGTQLRLDVEATARAEQWPLVSTPADADLLVVCGTVDGELRDVVGRLASAMPHPAQTVELSTDEPCGVTDSLQEARRRLWRMLDRRPVREVGHGEHSLDSDSGAGHDDGNDDGHSHDDMEMPGGLAMADRAEDRDGLKLDVLHLPLGPALVGWPFGLRVVLRIQGDVVQSAEIGIASRQGRSWWDEPWSDSLRGEPVPVATAERRRAACHLDSLVRLLLVAGDDHGAKVAARLRDGVLAGGDPANLRDGVMGLRRRLDRWRLLNQVTAGTGRLDRDTATRLDVSGPALRATGQPTDLRQSSVAYPGFEPVIVTDDCDVRARWRQWLAETELALVWVERGGGGLDAVHGSVEGPRGTISEDRSVSASRALLRAMEEVLPGQELAAARLTVASLDPDVEAVGTPVGSGMEPV